MPQAPGSLVRFWVYYSNRCIAFHVWRLFAFFSFGDVLNERCLLCSFVHSFVARCVAKFLVSLRREEHAVHGRELVNGNESCFNSLIQPHRVAHHGHISPHNDAIAPLAHDDVLKANVAGLHEQLEHPELLAEDFLQEIWETSNVFMDADHARSHELNPSRQGR